MVDTGFASELTSTTAKDDIYAFFFDQAGIGLQGAKITQINPSCGGRSIPVVYGSDLGHIFLFYGLHLRREFPLPDSSSDYLYYKKSIDAITTVRPCSNLGELNIRGFPGADLFMVSFGDMQ